MSDILLSTQIHEHISVGWPAKTYICKLCVETECNLENLPMTDKYG